MNEQPEAAVLHLQEQPRKVHRCGVVTIGEHNGNLLVCLHVGKWRGRSYPARVIMAATGTVEELVEHAKSVTVIPPATDDRKNLQEQAIREHFAAFVAPLDAQDALTACYFWDC